MTLLLASAARATVGGRSGQEDAFRLWPAEGAVPAERRGRRTAGGARRRHGRAHRRRDRRPDGLQDLHRGLLRRHRVFRGAAENSPATRATKRWRKGVEQNAALQGMGCTIVGRLDRRPRHPLDQRRRLAPAALPPARRHPPQCRPFAGLVPGRAGAPEQDHALRGPAETATATPCARRSRAPRSISSTCAASPWSCARAIGSCSPATASARFPATRSPTSSTISANPRPARWRTD